jgi:hypothetical protein
MLIFLYSNSSTLVFSSWKQTLQDLDISITVPKGTRGRDLDVIIKKNHIKVGLKGQPPIVEVSLSFKNKTTP